MSEDKLNQQDLANPVDISGDVKGANDPDKILDYSKLMQQVYFIGNTPFSTIIEGIKEQFQDYININDTTNYVEVFYRQLFNSYESINNDVSEEYPQEAKDGLNTLHNIFVDTILHLFATRLFISINGVEDMNKNDLEFIIQRTYEYFIMNAKRNFKTVISTSINGMISETINDDDEYFQQLQSLMELFSPLIQKVTPTEFLQLTGDKEVYDLFTNNRITGNFLRKYTPKLYQNEVFAVEIINYTTMAHLFKEELERPMTAEEEAILQNKDQKSVFDQQV